MIISRNFPKGHDLRAQNVGLATCFKTLENSGFYPYNKPNIDFLGLSMPIDKG